MSYRPNFEEFCEVNDAALWAEFEEIMPLCSFDVYCSIRHKWPR